MCVCICIVLDILWLIFLSHCHGGSHVKFIQLPIIDFDDTSEAPRNSRIGEDVASLVPPGGVSSLPGGWYLWPYMGYLVPLFVSK